MYEYFCDQRPQDWLYRSYHHLQRPRVHGFPVCNISPHFARFTCPAVGKLLDFNPAASETIEELLLSLLLFFPIDLKLAANQAQNEIHGCIRCPLCSPQNWTKNQNYFGTFPAVNCSCVPMLFRSNLHGFNTDDGR